MANNDQGRNSHTTTHPIDDFKQEIKKAKNKQSMPLRQGFKTIIKNSPTVTVTIFFFILRNV